MEMANASTATSSSALAHRDLGINAALIEALSLGPGRRRRGVEEEEEGAGIWAPVHTK